MKHVAVMGYGTVGSGVYEVLTKNKNIVSKNVGEELNVKYVLDLREFPGDPVENVLTHNFDDILNDEEVSVVAEVMGGIEPAYTFTKKCLLAGKSVCTSNKALVEKHGAELLAIAKEYLEPLKEKGIDTLILGCTHYPLLSGIIAKIMGDDVKLISSGGEAGKYAKELLAENGLLNDSAEKGKISLYCTDSAELFLENAKHFLEGLDDFEVKSASLD